MNENSEKKRLEIEMIQLEIKLNVRGFFETLEVEVTDKQVESIDRYLSGWLYCNYWMMDYIQRLPDNVTDMVLLKSRRQMLRFLQEEEDHEWSKNNEVDQDDNDFDNQIDEELDVLRQKRNRSNKEEE
jgi:hypothetical protein